MLTISQLASYAGVTVRAVRHYHAKGLLPEPARDASGYRRYDAAAVVQLIRIRTLADAGVPLRRVSELLCADGTEFAEAVADIDRRLRAEIRERQRHRELIGQLAAGDSLALPAEVVAYLDRMHELGFRKQLIDIERDSWILIAAQVPEEVPGLMAIKRVQIEDETLRELYVDFSDLVDCGPDDPRLPGLADRVAAFVEAAAARTEGMEEEQPVGDDLVALLDAAFLDSFACAPRLLELLEERGWTGWTNMQRVAPGPAGPSLGASSRGQEC
ncbi:MerR family transcriptional regulator [Motilibacter aurantiacus]|uniref:MerR family transcriptional regulator n=1 Tax=Motilibacter aurantiacus TaxID=2714955 RepID=UPI00140DB383|nr:MerR family transcriptional regulator [Motilibacter aurantiacus]NHC43664.1 MerR family transcriptional regulator [Motilibacter aurantiacus]